MAGLIHEDVASGPAEASGAGLLAAPPPPRGRQRGQPTSLLSQPSPAQGQGGGLLAAPGGKAAINPDSVEALDQEAKAVGAPDIPQESPGVFRRALDLISRGMYASAGAGEELFTPQGGGLAAVPGRIGTELFSGIGGLQGQKKDWTQVLEEAGVAKHGSFSDIVPALYNDTGEGWRFQRGGPLDPTGRGALGLVLNVVTDPLTYVGLGEAGKFGKAGEFALSKAGSEMRAAKFAEALAETSKAAPSEAAIAASKEFGIPLEQAAEVEARRAAQAVADSHVEEAIRKGAKGLEATNGITFAGVKIADNPISAIANSGMAQNVKDYLASSKVGPPAAAAAKWFDQNLSEPIRNLFVKWNAIRKFEGAPELFEDAANKVGYLNAKRLEDMQAGPLGEFWHMTPAAREEIFRPVIDAYESGGLDAVPAQYRPAMQYMRDKAAQMFEQEKASGLIGSDQELENYIAHYYRNSPEDLRLAIFNKTGEYRPLPSILKLGRNAEERAFDTLKDASESSYGVKLQPVYDPIDILDRRWGHSINKRVQNELVTNLATVYGELPFKASEVFDLARPAFQGTAEEAAKIEAMLAKGKTPLEEVAKLSDAGKREFLARRFSGIESRIEAENALKKYQEFEDFYPKGTVNASRDLAADGTPFMPVKTPGGNVLLPEKLAQEVQRANSSYLTNPNLRTLLKGYDKINNFWKGSVTWTFPAFWTRNAYSHVAMAGADIGLAALDPAKYIDAAQILFTKNPGVMETALGPRSFDSIREALKRQSVNMGRDAMAEFTGKEGISQATTVIGKAAQAAREGGVKVTNAQRAQLFLNYIKRGLTDEEAGARVKQFLVDYEKGLTPFEQQWMKRVMPFYTFQKQNMVRQIDNILHRPGLTAAELKPFSGRRDENAQMTAWDAGALRLRLNRDGKTVQMLTGIDLPIRNLDLLFRGDIKGTVANFFGMMSPLIKTPVELATGTSLFTGKPFDRAYSPTAGRIVEQMPSSVQKWLGYKKTVNESGKPEYSFDGQRFYLLAQSYVTSRWISTSDRQFREYIDRAQPDQLSSALDWLTGLRYKEMNMDEETQKRLKERKAQVEQMLVRWGQRRNYVSTYKQKGQ